MLAPGPHLTQGQGQGQSQGRGLSTVDLDYKNTLSINNINF